MERLSRYGAVILAISILITLSSANAQTIPKPSVPEFTVKYVDYSFDVPPKYGIDQYTGQNITIQSGYHVDNRSIEFTIKNQQFTSNKDSSGNAINLYYNFRFKGSYGESWIYYPERPDGSSVIHYSGGPLPTNDYEDYPPYYRASNSDYTITPLGINLIEIIGNQKIGVLHQELTNGINIQFEIQAMIGYFTRNSYGYFIFTGQTSDWSSTKTITISDESVSPTQSSTSQMPTINTGPHTEPFPIETVLVVASILTTVVVISLLLYVRHLKRTNAIKN
jgi:hypothetical protein